MPKGIRPLVLSFWTPPAVRPQAILIGKMILEWIKQGINSVIMAYISEKEWNINAPIYKITKFNYRRFLSRILLIRKWQEKIYYKKLLAVACEIIKKHNCNIIFSFSNPQESNILGAMLKEKLGIKFISHFSDPWYDHPFASLSASESKNILKQEEYVIKNSDRVIFTNEPAKNLVMKKYPEGWQNRARVIPHCFDSKDYSVAPASEKNKKFVFSYIGAFYKQRNPELFFKALQNLLKQKPELSEKIVLRLVGCVNEYAGYSEKRLKEIIKNYNLSKVVEILPTVNYTDSIKHMLSSDCLVVIDADIKDSPFLPSKVVDYAGSGKMIVGITPDNSPTKKLLAGLGYRSFNYKQGLELEKYLEDLIREKVSVEVNKIFLNKYDVKNTTAQLIQQFKEVLLP